MKEMMEWKKACTVTLPPALVPEPETVAPVDMLGSPIVYAPQPVAPVQTESEDFVAGLEVVGRYWDETTKEVLGEEEYVDVEKEDSDKENAGVGYYSRRICPF